MNVTESILQKLSRWKRDPKFTGLRKITNQMYYDEDTATLELPRLLGHAILEIDGCKFNVDQTVGGLHALIAYPYTELARPDDIALDLGAFVGGITIPLAKKVKKVYALEPLYYEELRTNVKLNDLSNVVVIPAALGKEENTTRIRYGTKETLVPTTSFQKLKELAGHIDFLKSNCEGGEWGIGMRDILVITLVLICVLIYMRVVLT